MDWILWAVRKMQPLGKTLLPQFQVQPGNEDEASELLNTPPSQFLMTLLFDLVVLGYLELLIFPVKLY